MKKQYVLLLVSFIALLAVAAAQVWNTNKIVVKVKGAKLPDYVQVCGYLTGKTTVSCTPKYSTKGLSYKAVTWWFQVDKDIRVIYFSNSDPFYPASCKVKLGSAYKSNQWTTFSLLGHGYCETKNGYYP